MRDFTQHSWDTAVEVDCRKLVQLALAEDLGSIRKDWTTLALVDAEHQGAARVIAREPGIVAGLPTIPIVVEEAQAQINVTTVHSDGDWFESGACLAELQGNVRQLLSCERVILNFLGRLLGIATLTGQYVAEVADTKAQIYDTRKTIPGWRTLDKYAVHCGGARNHRTGLFDAVLIKDNHLAQGCANQKLPVDTAAAAIERVREFLNSQNGAVSELPIEIEVDSLEQLAAVLPVRPDIVLLDNMSPGLLQQAVALRDREAPEVLLEASGGVRIETLRELAMTGVDRISVGALTHSVRALDVGLDWIEG